MGNPAVSASGTANPTDLRPPRPLRGRRTATRHAGHSVSTIQCGVRDSLTQRSSPAQNQYLHARSQLNDREISKSVHSWRSLSRPFNASHLSRSGTTETHAGQIASHHARGQSGVAGILEFCEVPRCHSPEISKRRRVGAEPCGRKRPATGHLPLVSYRLGGLNSPNDRPEDARREKSRTE